MTKKFTIDELFQKRNDSIDVVVTNFDTQKFIMLAKVNKKAFLDTLKTGYVHFYDEYNKESWLIGEHSEKRQKIKEIRLDMCHARRHTLSLHFLVEEESGSCKFGMNRCDFFVLKDDKFVLDEQAIQNKEECQKFIERIYTLTDIQGDRESFIKRFSK